YHAGTRFSPNGSATEGIWFFQEDMRVCSSGPNAGTALCVGNTTTLAQHKVGDLFFFISYGGNGSATIQASTWQVADGPSGKLGPAPGTITQCGSGVTNADVCAVTNTSNLTLGAPAAQGGVQAPGTGFNVRSNPPDLKGGFAGFPSGGVPALQ